MIFRSLCLTRYKLHLTSNGTNVRALPSRAGGSACGGQCWGTALLKAGVGGWSTSRAGGKPQALLELARLLQAAADKGQARRDAAAQGDVALEVQGLELWHPVPPEQGSGFRVGCRPFNVALQEGVIRAQEAQVRLAPVLQGQGRWADRVAGGA